MSSITRKNNRFDDHDDNEISQRKELKKNKKEDVWVREMKRILVNTEITTIKIIIIMMMMMMMMLIKLNQISVYQEC